MIYVALALLGFGVADLTRWSPDEVGLGRAGFATAGGTTAIVLVGALGGFGLTELAVAGALALPVLWLWSAYDLLGLGWARPQGAVALVVLVFAILVGFSGQADPVGGDLATWYDGLGFGFASKVPADQFLLGAGGVAAAGFVIAAKGLLRFREIRGAGGSGVDEVTEYFLIGTFASTLLAGAASVLVLAGG